MNNRYKDKLKKLDPIKGTDNWNINSLPIHHKSRRSKNIIKADYLKILYLSSIVLGKKWYINCRYVVWF